MEESEVVRLLQHYRHDLMNRLQLVHGYLSMGKIDKVEEKMDELFSHFNEERKLIGLEAPKFILWLIQFNNNHKNLQISYTIHIENQSLSDIDELLLSKCQKVIDYCEKIIDPLEIYNGNLILNEKESGKQIEVIFNIKGHFNEVHTFTINEENSKSNIKVLSDTKGIECRFQVPRN
ncbi:Spo0B domain-containing protein [Oceanobacillus halophilus]|uniref:SpoOB alpha-helical domain-containing protein n=1 Tax=Oceanobacillus halophilus TaxID=930130 RepID=A0A495AH68_9BACI|nr:Spo0B domain-containing protein [Oceanobacillus halophilus]RKQ37905.1 hypothetical protein D8M06_03655 [Oceanobacillus halophilus]